MAKTQLTRDIEAALHAWHPTSYGGYRADSFRQGFDALEVPVECGSVKSGLVDFVRVQECFTAETKYAHRNGYGCSACCDTGKGESSNLRQEYFIAGFLQGALFRAMVPLPQDESSVYARCRHHLCGNQDFRERFSLGTRAQFRRALQLLCDAHRAI